MRCSVIGQRRSADRKSGDILARKPVVSSTILQLRKRAGLSVGKPGAGIAYAGLSLGHAACHGRETQEGAVAMRWLVARGIVSHAVARSATCPLLIVNP